MTHIAVCICTYKRPDYLRRLLKEVASQETGGLFTYSIVIADNDESESARPVVSEFAASSAVQIKYCVEPVQNIALARNKAIANASGDFIAWIDDDEFPKQGWLLNAFNTCAQYEVDGVLGPVNRYFDDKPPDWIVKGNFYQRPTHKTGFVIPWNAARTSNVLLRSKLFAGEELPFRPEFRTGEDQDFFWRMIEKGHAFVWCNEAVVFEVVPPFRWRRTVMLKRALLRGATAVLHPTFGAMGIAKSIVAVPLYTFALPFALIMGQHKFMSVLVSLFDHIGKLLGAVGINPVRQSYVTE
ncbi:MAG TPA: glycosyltransferase family 2 protein [Opitutaceae bacterium]|nr:glycosyltransferase family 2 protein [Opitutaceae bacterium]